MAILVALVVLGGSCESARATVPSTAIRYAYTSDGRLSALINPASESALYSWDAAGNLSAVTRKSSSKLSIIQLEPVAGAVGETINIWGTGFSTTPTSDTVKFHGTAATVTAATAYTLAVKVPTGATSGTVTVQTPTEGPVTSSQSFTVASAVGTPTVTSLSASVVNAGTTVTMSGTNFETVASNDVVKVNRIDVQVTSASSTSIKFVVPEGTLGGHVTVSTQHGSTVGPDLYIPPNGILASRAVSTSRLSLGGSTTTEIGTAGKVGLAIFDATAGQRVSFVSSEVSIASGAISIWTPEGKKLESGFFYSGETGMIEPVTVPVTGTYTILIEPESTFTGKLKLSAYAVEEVTGTISPTTGGAEKLVSLPVPGENARYSVTVSAGEAVSLKTSGTTFNGEYFLEWYNSEGGFISRKGFHATENGFVKQVEFAAAGTYTLVVNPERTTTGATTLTAYNATTVTGSITPKPEGESKTVALGVPGQLARITFAGATGQKVSVLPSEVSIANGAVRIISPEGHVLGGVGISSGASEMLEPVTLPESGTYTIFVEPEGPDTGSLKLAAYLVEEVTGTISPTTGGAEKTVSLPAPGENASYSVTVSAGEAVSLKTASTTFNGEYTLEWYNSEGGFISRKGFRAKENGFVKQVEFAAAGTYTLVVNPERATTGSTTLTAYNASSVTGSITPTAEGASKTVTISVPGQHANITFSGSEGENVSLKASESTIAVSAVAIKNATGSVLARQEFNAGEEATLGPVTLASSGTYTIALEPEGPDTGSVKLTAYIGSPPHGLVIKKQGEPASKLASTATSPDASTGSALRLASLDTGPVLPASSPSQPNLPRARTLAQGGAGRGSARVLRSDVLPHGGPRAAGGWQGGSVPEATRAFRASGAKIWRAPASARGRLAWETGAPPSPWRDLVGMQAGPGVTALSGQVLEQDGLPIAGVRVWIQGASASAQTDNTGRFLLGGQLAAGRQVLILEGESTSGERYGTYETAVQLTAGKTNTLGYTIWLTALDPAGDHKVASPTKREERLEYAADPWS